MPRLNLWSRQQKTFVPRLKPFCRDFRFRRRNDEYSCRDDRHGCRDYEVFCRDHEFRCRDSRHRAATKLSVAAAIRIGVATFGFSAATLDFVPRLGVAVPRLCRKSRRRWVSLPRLWPESRQNGDSRHGNRFAPRVPPPCRDTDAIRRAPTACVLRPCWIVAAGKSMAVGPFWRDAATCGLLWRASSRLPRQYGGTRP